MGVFNPDGSWTSKSGTTYPNHTSDFGPDALEHENNVNTGDDKGVRWNEVNTGQTGSEDQPKYGNMIDDAGVAIGFNPLEITEDAPGASLQADAANIQRRSQQDWVAQMQQQAATGDGAWQQSFAQAVQASKNAAQSLGQSDARQDSGGALYDIGQAQGATRARAAGEGEMLREQAKLDARGQLADQLGGIAQADIGQDVEEARIQRERRAANQALVDQTGKNRQNTQKAITGSMGSFSEGGKVPGRAQVFGDDTRNDTVPAMLSPGEIVIPREVVQQSPDAAARFVAAVKAQGGARGHAEGGETGIKQGSADELARKGGYIGYLGGPDIGRTVQYGVMRGMADKEGGTIDDSRYQQTAQQQGQLASLFAGQATGSGPSIVPIANMRAVDDTMGAGMAAQGRAPAGEVLKGAATAGAEAAGDAGRQRAQEQSRGQDAYARAVKQRRGQELQLASAKQQAGWQKTMADVGMSLEQQAAVRNSLAGAGQAATAFASMGKDEKNGRKRDSLSGSDAVAADESGDRGGVTDLSTYNDDPEFKAYGGVVGMADGGQIVARGPNGERLLTEKQQGEEAADERRAQIYAREREKRKGAEWEEEGAGPRSKKTEQPKEHESRFVRAVRDAARKAGGMVAGFAEGGGVPDAGGYQSYDPYAVPERRDRGPEVVYVSPTPVPGTQPLDISGAGGGGEPPSFGGTGGAGGASGAVQMDRGSAGASGGPSDNQIPQHEAIQPRAERPPVTPTTLPAGVMPKGGAPTPAPAPAPAGVTPKPGNMSSRPSGAAADEMARKAALAQYEADNRAAVASGETAAAEANAIETAANERKAVVARTQQKVAEAQTRYQRAADEMARVDTSVDPGRFWATRSTGDKIVLTLGLIMGAMGASSDGINRAANILNDAVNRDLDAQKAEHELRLKKGGAQLGAAQNFYAMAREMAGDEVAATDLAHAAALQSVIAKGKALMAQTKDPQAQAQLAAAIAQIEQGAAARAGAAWEKSADRALEREKINAARGKDATAAKDLRNAVAANASIEQMIGDLKGLIGDTNIVTEKVGDKAARMETIASQLVTKIKEQEKLGAYDKGTADLAEKIIGDPNATFTFDSTKISKLNEVLKNSRRDVQNLAGAMQ